MEEIEVGEYIRTFSGEIAKTTGISTELGSKVYLTDKYIKSSRDYYIFENDNAITKHSKDIIDLISPRDFVNTEYVLYVSEKDKKVYTELNNEISENEILNILTHEQYEQNCYKIGE